MRFNQIPIGTLGSLRQAIAAVLLVSSFTPTRAAETIPATPSS